MRGKSMPTKFFTLKQIIVKRVFSLYYTVKLYIIIFESDNTIISTALQYR